MPGTERVAPGGVKRSASTWCPRPTAAGSSSASSPREASSVPSGGNSDGTSGKNAFRRHRANPEEPGWGGDRRGGRIDRVDAGGDLEPNGERLALGPACGHAASGPHPSVGAERRSVGALVDADAAHARRVRRPPEVRTDDEAACGRVVPIDAERPLSFGEPLVEQTAEAPHASLDPGSCEAPAVERVDAVEACLATAPRL